MFVCKFAITQYAFLFFRAVLWFESLLYTPEQNPRLSHSKSKYFSNQLKLINFNVHFLTFWSINSFHCQKYESLTVIKTVNPLWKGGVDYKFNTLICSISILYHQQWGNISSRFFGNSEANASELPENLDGMFLGTISITICWACPNHQPHNSVLTRTKWLKTRFIEFLFLILDNYHAFIPRW